MGYSYKKLVAAMEAAVEKGVPVLLRCGHRKNVVGRGTLPVAATEKGAVLLILDCPLCGGEEGVVRVLHPLWHKAIEAMEVLDGDPSRIPVARLRRDAEGESILVAVASGGYEIWPLQFSTFSELEGYSNSREWIHSLEETQGAIEWLRPEYAAALPSLETGKEWEDQWGNPHPVIVNAYDWVTTGSATYKVGAAVFDSVPTEGEVASRWDCNTPLNRVRLA